MRIARSLALILSLLAAPALAQEVENPLLPSPLWDDLRLSIIGTEDEPPLDPSVLLLDAPKRADNPALVPVRTADAAMRPIGNWTELARLVLGLDVERGLGGRGRGRGARGRQNLHTA